MLERLEEDLADLLERGVLRFASQPPMNPRDFDVPSYTVPLIEHDYPAKTPAMWNSAYEAFGLEHRNIMLVGDPSNASAIYRALRRDLRYLGGGAGVGFKETAVEHVDELDEFATAAGSVNFVSKRVGTLRGHNTDGSGFTAALEDLLGSLSQSLAGKRVLLIGSGGTGKAVAMALAKRGARLHIVNRTKSKAKSLADHVNTYFGRHVAESGSEDETGRIAPVSDIIVNVSIKGAGPLAEYSALGPAKLPVTPGNVDGNLTAAADILDRIAPAVILCDVVIGEGDTPFLRQGRQRNLQVLDGVAMVINQAVEAFWILHSRELADANVRKSDVASVMRFAACAR